MDEGHTNFGRVGNVQNSSALNSLDGGGDGMGDVAVGGSGGMASGGVTSGGVSAVGDGVAAGDTVSGGVVAGGAAQSEIAIDGAKAGRTRKRVENLGLKVTLGVLMLAIVGLGVGVGMYSGSNDEGIYEQSEYEIFASRADILRRDIEYKLENNSDYSVDDALGDYENAMNEGGNVWRVSVAFPYAWFIYEYLGDLDGAVTVLTSIEPIIDDGQLPNYYKVLTNMYSEAGMDAEAEYYEQLMVSYDINAGGGVII